MLWKHEARGVAEKEIQGTLTVTFLMLSMWVLLSVYVLSSSFCAVSVNSNSREQRGYGFKLEEFQVLSFFPLKYDNREDGVYSILVSSLIKRML